MDAGPALAPRSQVLGGIRYMTSLRSSARFLSRPARRGTTPFTDMSRARNRPPGSTPPDRRQRSAQIPGFILFALELIRSRTARHPLWKTEDRADVARPKTHTQGRDLNPHWPAHPMRLVFARKETGLREHVQRILGHNSRIGNLKFGHGLCREQPAAGL